MVRAANIKIESARHLLNDPIVGNVLLIKVEDDAYMVTPAEYNKIQKIVKYLKLEVDTVVERV